MSIRWKLVVVSIALVFVVILAMGTFIIYALRADAADAAEEELAARAAFVRLNVIDAAVAQVGAASSLDELEGHFFDAFGLVAHGDMELFIIGAYPYPRQVVPLGLDGFLHNRLVIEAMGGESVFSAFRRNPTDAERWFEYAYPVFLEGNDTASYVIYLRMSAEEFFDSLGSTTNIMFFGGMIALGSAILLGIAFSVPLTRNLLKLNKEIVEFEVGSAPIELVGAKDEIGQLAEGFNTMSQDLSRSLTDMTNEKNKMEIIMYNMTDGVLAYDAGGSLIHSNYACEALLGIENIRQISMTELFVVLDVRLPSIQHLDNMEDTIIGRGEKFINASFNTYKDDAGKVLGIVIVFQDITKHMHLDNMRKDFVANVSHELRTPLTTIKGYAETLMDGAADVPHFRDNFLEIINNEADRMTDIIRDLLELSRFDGKGMEFDFVRTDLVALTSRNIQNHIINAEKQGKELSFITEINRAEVLIDASRINQVLNNIISNSLRYSHEGAQIQVYIGDRADSYMIYIQDDGIGIPK